MALIDLLGIDTGGEDSPTSQMLSELTEIFADGRGGGYNVDAVLTTLALSVMRLDTAIIECRCEVRELQSYVLDLETRILEAGLPLAKRY